jgi:hypothetical protein
MAKQQKLYTLYVERNIFNEDGSDRYVTVTYTLRADSEDDAKEILVNRAASRGGWQGEWIDGDN